MAYAAELCGSKLRAKLSSTLNEESAEKISSTSFAAKQMAKMGWKEGTGLGKKRDGITSHIKVQKREENIGLGVEKERTRQLGVEGMWWNSSVANTLMKLQKKNSGGSDEQSKKKKSKKEKKSKKSKKNDFVKTSAGKIYTDEELFAATGGARFGTKGGKRAEGKWQRSESSKELKDWEEDVKDKAEWNGLGKANVILSENNQSSTKRNKKRRRSDEEGEDDRCEEKKEDDSRSLSKISELSNEKNDSELKEQKKRKKSEKKSKKKKSKK